VDFGVFGAIVIVGIENLGKGISGSSSSLSPSTSLLADIPLEGVELLGQSVLQRTLEHLRRAGEVAVISALSESDHAANDRLSSISKQCGVSYRTVADAWSGVAMKAKEYQQGGVERMLVIHGRAYVELDLRDLVQFHGEKGQKVTSIQDVQGPLAAWIVDSAHLATNPDALTATPPLSATGYTVRGYVNRLVDSRDLRHIVVEALRSRGRFQPNGREIRPGVWMGEGADVDRRAQLLAPVYIGSGAKVGNACRIAECSNIERDCEIDDGTEVSDSSVLENSYVGMGLEICHSIVNGNKLQSLERDATVTMSDRAVMRPNKPQQKEPSHPAPMPARDDERVLLAPAEESAS
jgi:NDP-sugar pyrophosphorylase family protein